MIVINLHSKLNHMSNEDIVLSLSPTGAEDESLSGTHSVLALMRMSKDLMNRHLSVIGQIHSSLTEGELLSTAHPTLRRLRERGTRPLHSSLTAPSDRGASGLRSLEALEPY